MGKASSGKRAAKAGGTRDHTVPQMYLKHFAQHVARRKYELKVRRLDKINEPFTVTPTGIAAETGYYWGLSAEGAPHHHVEELFTSLEGQAETVLKVLLHDPDWALTPHWPLSPDQRHVLAWWMAAQILRTTRQRKRLTHQQTEAPNITDMPQKVHTLAQSNPHLRYIVENIVTLALTLEARPWALGFSDMCLLTSDTPIAIWNRPDDEDQLRAAALSDILLPLDSHRFLFLPGPATRGTDRRKHVEHLMHAEGAIGFALVEVAYDVADEFVIHHPEHDPSTGSQTAQVSPNRGTGRRILLLSPSWSTTYFRPVRTLKVAGPWSTHRLVPQTSCTPDKNIAPAHTAPVRGP